MIVFHSQSLGAEGRSQAAFLKFLKNKMKKKDFRKISPFFTFLCIFFNVLYFFLLETDGNPKKYACSDLGHSIPYKMFVSTI